MRRFSPRFETAGVVFLPATEPVSASGAAGVTYPDPSAGVPVKANCQKGKAERTVVDDVDRYTQEYTVTLLDDPSALNGGLGVRRGDAFSWPGSGGRLAVAQHDATAVGSAWPVRCLASQ